MEIVNIIVCSLNSVDSIKSFIITDKDSRQSVVEQAEKEFERVAIEIGWNDDDHLNMETLLDQGYFSNENDKTVCISWSDKVTVVKEESPFDTTKDAYLSEVKELVNDLKHCFPIDLEKINQDFELENGGIVKQLNEGDVDYWIKADFEDISAEYENLGLTDLQEIITILDEVKAVDDKLQGSTKNENF